MRQTLLFFLSLALVLGAIPAEAFDGQLGVQVYGSNNKFSGSLPPDGSWKGQSRPGFGLIAEWNLSPDISLGLHPSYNTRATQQVFERSGEIVSTTDYDVNYLSVPLIIRVTGDPIGVRGFVTAGLDFGFRLDATVNDGTGDLDNTDQYQSTTLGALFGAGTMIPLGGQLLTLEIRYCQGLTDVVNRTDSVSDPGPAGPSVKYSGLQFVIGYMFQLGGN